MRLPLACLLIAASAQAQSIVYTADTSQVFAIGDSFSTGHWFFVVSQSTGQAWAIDRIDIHVAVAAPGEEHSLAGHTYTLNAYTPALQLISSSIPASIGAQFDTTYSSYRTFLFDLAPTTIASGDTVLFRLETDDTSPYFTHDGSTAAITDWQVTGWFYEEGVVVPVYGPLMTVYATSVAVPEASTYGLALGALALAVAARRRRR